MSAAFSPPATTVVDSLSSLRALLDRLVGLPTDPPSLFLDVKGIRRGGNGAISIISVYVAPQRTLDLVNVASLGESTFATASSHGTSLKTVLEAPDIPKVFFDVRDGSDALFRLYGVALQGVHDLQLMELATRRGAKGFVADLAQCIERDSTAPAAAKAEWRRAADDVDPEKGGREEVAHERPLPPEMIHACAQDVAFLPELFDTYDARLQPPGKSFWRKEVSKETAARIQLSQSPAGNPQGGDRAPGPWKRQYIRSALEEWNNDIMMKTLNAL